MTDRRLADRSEGPVEVPEVLDFGRDGDGQLLITRAPNTIIGADARFAGHVDLGSLGLGDRWSDLAIASRSLDGNFGEGWQAEFFAAYGVPRDEPRIRHFRALWDAAP